jgi:glycosyltransferase involved in cell wall biosynthesis
MDVKESFIIVPAYNVAKILPKTISELPKDNIKGIIVVDDGSSDNTADVAKGLGLYVIRHEKNRGYGATQKTGFKAALKMGACAVVMVHGDNQYDPTLAPLFISKIANDGFDVVTGTRMVIGDVLEKGMPLWKYVPNRFLTHLENFLFGTHLTDYHNGYRAYSANFLNSIPLDLLSDRFDFDTDIIIQAAIRRCKIGEIPNPTRYKTENSQMSFSKGVQYGLSILLTAVKYILHKIGFKNKLFSEKL